MNEIFQFFYNLFLMIWENISNLWGSFENVIQVVAAVFSNLINILSEGISWLIEFFGGIIEFFSDLFGGTTPPAA